MKLTDLENHWLVLALERGYENPFNAAPTVALRSLVLRGLLERNPSTQGAWTQWRPTYVATTEWEVIEVEL